MVVSSTGEVTKLLVDPALDEAKGKGEGITTVSGTPKSSRKRAHLEDPSQTKNKTATKETPAAEGGDDLAWEPQESDKETSESDGEPGDDIPRMDEDDLPIGQAALEGEDTIGDDGVDSRDRHFLPPALTYSRKFPKRKNYLKHSATRTRDDWAIVWRDITVFFELVELDAEPNGDVPRYFSLFRS